MINGVAEPVAHFAIAAEYGSWVAAQPIAGDVSRRSGSWREKLLEISYFDDQFPSGECRRRILFTSGEGEGDARLWKAFARHAFESGCHDIELFTTMPNMDRAWAELGARGYSESPVLTYGAGVSSSGLKLHGWDRENWTYLALDKNN
jgi:hypothetical protein